MNQPRIIAYCIAHYGKDYLPYVLHSVINYVHQVNIFYTPHPSHGHQTTVQCPETKEEIWTASDIGFPNIRRYELKNIFYEGQQRDYAVNICKQEGADLILVVDCDEIWPPDVLTKALDYVWQENKARNWLINFTHLWRSFNWVCRDQGWPVRILDMRHNGDIGYVPKEFGDIYHFGYAVPDSIMRYKWLIHGHKDELRPGWFENKWLQWPPPNDCHPTNEKGFWNPEPFNKELLPEIMKSHPFYNLDKVE